MKNFSILIIIALSLAFFGCGEEMEQVKKAAEVASKADDIAKQVEKDAGEAEKILAERKAEGDTLAIPYKDLQEMLPEEIDGYKVKNTDGESAQMGEFSYSRAERVYENENGEKLRIKLMDYNMAYPLYQSMSVWANMQMSRENDRELEKTFKPDIEHVVGMERLSKVGNKRAEVTYAIAYRFLLEVSAENQESTDFVKKAAHKAGLEKLAQM